MKKKIASKITDCKTKQKYLSLLKISTNFRARTHAKSLIPTLLKQIFLFERKIQFDSSDSGVEDFARQPRVQIPPSTSQSYD